MAVKFTSQSMNERLKANRAEQEAIRKKSAPVRDERDKLVAKIQPTEAEIRKLNGQIKTIEKDLYDLAMEESRLIKALPGNRNAEVNGGAVKK